MIYQNNHNCVVCNKGFDENDNMAVCHICGAPHHKDCYANTGYCFLRESHGTDKQWSEVNKSAEKIDDFNRCVNCGSENKPENSFCTVCGIPIQKLSKTAVNTGANIPVTAKTMISDSFKNFDMQETIDGATIKDISIFVGVNTRYFLLVFKRIFMGRLFTFNFAAFILGSFYFFYRKMYLWAVLIFLIEFVLILPYSIWFLSRQGIIFTNVNEQSLNALSGLFSFISFLFNFGVGLYTNRIYMRKVIKDIKRIKEMNIEDELLYNIELAKKGNVLKSLPLILLGAVIVMWVLISVFSAGGAL